MKKIFTNKKLFSILTLIIALTFTFSFLETDSFAASKKFTLTSSAFKNNGSIPVKYANTGIKGGKNISIPLSWSNAPKGTKSFAIIVYDLNKVASNWVHWAVINIPSNVSKISESASCSNSTTIVRDGISLIIKNASMPKNSLELNNTFGFKGYGGPEPPSGTGVHKYRIVIYALNTSKVSLNQNVTYTSFSKAMKGKTLSSAELIGTYFQK